MYLLYCFYTGYKLMVYNNAEYAKFRIVAGEGNQIKGINDTYLGYRLRTNNEQTDQKQTLTGENFLTLPEKSTLCTEKYRTHKKNSDTGVQMVIAFRNTLNGLLVGQAEHIQKSLEFFHMPYIQTKCTSEIKVCYT